MGCCGFFYYGSDKEAQGTILLIIQATILHVRPVAGIVRHFAGCLKVYLVGVLKALGSECLAQFVPLHI